MNSTEIKPATVLPSSPAWERICPVSELQVVGRKLVRLQSGRGIILFSTTSSTHAPPSEDNDSTTQHTNGTSSTTVNDNRTPSNTPVTNLYAMDHGCYHHGGPLVDGEIEDFGNTLCVSCPWHKYKISLQTGECLYVGLDFTTKTQLVKSKGIKQRVHPIRIVTENGIPVIYVCDIAGIHTIEEARSILQYEETVVDTNTIISNIHVVPGIEIWLQQQQSMGLHSKIIDSDVYANVNPNSERFTMCALSTDTNNTTKVVGETTNSTPSSVAASLSSSSSSSIPLHSTFKK